MIDLTSIYSAGVPADRVLVNIGPNNNRNIAAIVTETVRPEEYGARSVKDQDDTPAFTEALATGKKLLLGAHTYRVNLRLIAHFDIDGQGMTKTRLIAHDPTKPVVTNMFREPSWNYPCISNMVIDGKTKLADGFSFGDWDKYSAGDELIGRVRMTNVKFENVRTAILKSSGNIGNIYDNVSCSTADYFYKARGASVAGAPADHVMHTGADLFLGGQVSNVAKMCIMVMDNTGGVGQWSFHNTIFQFNPGGLVYLESGPNNMSTAFEAFAFFNVWNEGNATAASVEIDTLAGKKTIVPSSKLVNQGFGPDYINIGKCIQHGTNSQLARVNLWGNERAAINLESGGYGNGDWTDIVFTSIAAPTVIGSRIRSILNNKTDYSRDLEIHGGAKRAFAVLGTGQVIIGEGRDWNFNPPANAHGLYGNAAVLPGEVFMEFAAPSGTSNARIRFKSVNGGDSSSSAEAAANFPVAAATGRSINAGGTVNTNGLDYAEYMKKATGVTDLAKGAIVGITANGELTDVFANAIDFCIKSTNPSYVGGDTWSSSNEPQKASQEYLDWDKRLGDFRSTEPLMAKYQTEDGWKTAQSKWVIALEELKAARPADPISAEWKQWAATEEIKRRQYDRIAFSGQVPCNVIGAKPGDTIVPAAGPKGSIIGKAVTKPSFEEYMTRVGTVWKVMEDGRAWVSVCVA